MSVCVYVSVYVYVSRQHFLFSDGVIFFFN